MAKFKKFKEFFKTKTNKIIVQYFIALEHIFRGKHLQYIKRQTKILNLIYIININKFNIL